MTVLQITHFHYYLWVKAKCIFCSNFAASSQHSNGKNSNFKINVTKQKNHRLAKYGALWSEGTFLHSFVICFALSLHSGEQHETSWQCHKNSLHVSSDPLVGYSTQYHYTAIHRPHYILYSELAPDQVHHDCTIRTRTGITDAHTTHLWLYMSTCVSRHPQLRTGQFYWSKVLLLTCPCWRPLAYLDLGEEARILLNGVNYTSPYNKGWE